MNKPKNYQELVNRLDNVFLFNKVPELDPEIFEGLENGELGEDQEVFQWYLIGKNDADYLKRNTSELVFYSEVLDEYVWGVTHFGTPWGDVEVKQ